jgi:hypothetical protein
MAVGMVKLGSRNSRSGKIGSAARRAASSQAAAAAMAVMINAGIVQAETCPARPTMLASNTTARTAIPSKIAPA